MREREGKGKRRERVEERKGKENEGNWKGKGCEGEQRGRGKVRWMKQDQRLKRILMEYMTGWRKTRPWSGMEPGKT